MMQVLQMLHDNEHLALIIEYVAELTVLTLKVYSFCSSKEDRVSQCLSGIAYFQVMHILLLHALARGGGR